MYGASVLGIILGFLVSIFNSRILGPERFGDFKFIETVARLIGSVVSVGLFISLTRLVAMKKNEKNTRKFLGLFTSIFAIISVLGLLLFFCFSFVEPYFFENQLDDVIRKYAFIVIVIIGNVAIMEILKGLHKIYTIAILSVLPILSYLISAYVLSSFIPFGLESILLLYYGIQLIFLATTIFFLKPDFKFKKNLLNELLEENKLNGRPIYYGSLAGVATTHLAGLSISYFMDNTQVGFFMLSLTICSPLLVIPSVLGTIYFKKFVEIDKIPSKVIYFSAMSTVIALVFFYLLIEKVVITFYSSDYLPVSDISKFLILAFIFHGLGDLINRFLGAKGKGKLLRNAAFLVGIVNVLGYTILINYFNINGAIITKILASAFYLSIMLFYYLNFIKANKKEIIQN
jgi:O-antigen/teichoic acid export membrane protein